MGSAAKQLVVKFVSDTAKGARDADAYFARIKRGMASVSGGMGRGGVSRMTESQLFGAGLVPGYAPWLGNMPGSAAETSKAAKAMDKVTKSSKGLSAAGNGLSNTLRRTIFGVIRAKTAFSALGGILQAIPTWAKAGVAGLFLFREAFKHGMMVESSKIIMETLTGNEAMASDLIKKARKYSVWTMFKPEEVLGATTTAIQRGINPYKMGAYGLAKDKNAMDIFAGLGSMTNPLTGQVLGVNRMAEAILRGDYRLLRPVRGIINPAYEKAKATSGGNVGTPAFNVKFIEELGKIPAIMELAKRQSESVQGLWSTISGLWQEFWMDFTGAQHQKGVVTFWSQIRDILKDVRDNLLPAYEKMQPVITEFGHAVGSVIKLIYTVGKEILPALAFGRLMKLLPILFTVGKAIFGWLPIFRILRMLVLSQFIKPLMPLLLQVVGVLNQIGIFINNTLIRAFQFLAKVANAFMRIFFGSSLDKLMNKLSEFITGMQMYIQFWGIYIDYVFAKLELRIDKATFAIKNFFRYLKEIFDRYSKLGLIQGFLSTPGSQYLEKETPEQKKKAIEQIKKMSPAELKNLITPNQSLQSTEIWKERTKQGIIPKDETEYMMMLEGFSDTIKKNTEVNNLLLKKLNEEKVGITKSKSNKLNTAGEIQ